MTYRIKTTGDIGLKLSAVFHQYYNALVLYTDRYIGIREESMSVVQDVFVAVCEREEPFMDEEELRRFMYTVARNKALDSIRKRKAADNYRRNTMPELSHHEERLGFVEEETFRLLFTEIDKLQNNQREVLLLALDNKSNDEIAELLDISVNTVKFHKKNAYKVLRDKLAGHYFLSFLL